MSLSSLMSLLSNLVSRFRGKDGMVARFRGNNELYLVPCTLYLCLCLLSCTSPDPWVEPDDYVLSLDGRTTRDSNGFYHLKLMRDRFQTVHRITGSLLDTAGKPPYQEQKVWWESSHTWTFAQGDTLMRIFRRKVDYRGRWVFVDSSTIIAPGTMIVPTVNPASYSSSTGEINTMIGPVLSMLGDTMTIQCMWTSQWYTTDTIRKEIQIILE